MFDDDPFDDIFNQFFGNSSRIRRSKVRRIQEEEQNTQFIEDEEYIYFIMELPGYSEKDIQVSVSNESITISARNPQKSESQDYLAQKHREGMTFSEKLPSNVKTKGFSKTFKNGVLEVAFVKK